MVTAFVCCSSRRPVTTRSNCQLQSDGRPSPPGVRRFRPETVRVRDARFANRNDRSGFSVTAGEDRASQRPMRNLDRAVSLALVLSACTTSHDVVPGALSAADSSSPVDAASADSGALNFADIGPAVAISQDFKFTEGPVWDARAQVLYFVDIDQDAIYRLTLPDHVDTLVSPANHPDGLALDPQGRLIVAGFVSRSVEVVDGSMLDTLVDTYQGQHFNSPDDVTVRSDGSIYFTDPTFGIDGSQGFPTQTQELKFQGVFRLSPDGVVHAEDQAASGGPNGIEFSPAEDFLYVAYTSTGEVARFAVQADGSLTDRTTFASGVTVADSMCVDSRGDVYVASILGIAVFDATGKSLGTIPTLSQIPSNCTFGGPDRKTLFITVRSGFGASTTAAILRIDNMPIPGL